jgi:hypothetical protein
MGPATSINELGKSVSNDEAAVARAMTALCADEGGQPAWLRVLRGARADLAMPGSWRGVTLEVDMRGTCSFRFGITADGHVVYPLEPLGASDATLTGEPSEVLGLLLGDATLERALLSGVVVVASADAPLDFLSRIRHVAGKRLRLLIEGATAVAVGVKRWAGRPRDWTYFAPAFGVAAANTAPAVVAVVALWCGTAPPADTHPADPEVRTVWARTLGTSHPAGLSSAAQSIAKEGHTTGRATVGQGTITTTSAPIGPATLVVGRDQAVAAASARTASPGRAGDAETVLGVRFSCDSNSVRQTGCEAFGTVKRLTPGF